MKRLHINTAKMLLPALLAVTLFSCVRKDNFFPSNSPSTRKTIVEILNGGTPATVVKNPIDFVTTSQTVLAIDLRRDANDAGDLNTTMTVVVKDDTAAAHVANPSYLFMPSSWFSYSSESPRVGGTGGTFTFVFKPGEFAKQIYVVIPDATVMDPSALYGFGFTITSITGSGTISASKSLILEIGAKNPWDGVYAVTGPMVDVTNSALVQWANQAGYSDAWLNAHPGTWQANLVTVGASRCNVLDADVWGDYVHPIWTGTGDSYYGSFGMVVDFNPANNTVSAMHNYWGETAHGGSGAPNYQASNTRYATLDPSGVNAVQGNKDILIKYFMYHPAVVPSGPRVSFNEKWAYIGSR